MLADPALKPRPPAADDVTLHAHPDALDDLEDGWKEKTTNNPGLVLLDKLQCVNMVKGEMELLTSDRLIS